jgi:hypothetical protein
MMRIAALTGALLLGACASATLDSNEPRQERELSTKEKAALQAAFARKFLISPDEAKFKWMPVRYVAGSSETDYCGLLSEKTMFGSHMPFHVFHAVINQTGGEYLQGSIGRMMQDGAAPGNAMIAQNINNGLIEKYCNKAGYIDFSKAR